MGFLQFSQKSYCTVGCRLLGNRDGVVVRALASHQCDPGFDSWTCSGQSRLRFCVIHAEYSILTQNEMIVGSYWRKRKKQTKNPQKLYISTSKAAGNNKSKFQNQYVCLLALYEHAKWLVFQTTFVRVLFVSGVPIPRETGRSIHASFRVCSCVYVNFSFMKRQQK